MCAPREHGRNALTYLIRERGSPEINAAGDLQFGSWVVDGDHSVVDEVKQLTGANATILQLVTARRFA